MHLREEVLISITCVSEYFIFGNSVPKGHISRPNYIVCVSRFQIGEDAFTEKNELSEPYTLVHNIS
jgi:hypothetical protein